jgi:lipoate-protein ligase A
LNKPEWRFENTGLRSGVFNMEYDEALARELARGSGSPTIRLYGWRPPAISLGWNQAAEEVDREKASSAGIDVVRRPTGGRAILHCDELTYSVTMRVRGKNILVVYNEISRALVAGFHRLGARVAIEKSQPHFPSLYQTRSAAACFSSAGRYEITFGGKKLVGSAQRRYAAGDGEEVVLQHGSILLGSGHKRIADFLRVSSEEQRNALRHTLDEKTIDLSNILLRFVSFEEAAEAILFGFTSAWGISPVIGNDVENELRVKA